MAQSTGAKKRAKIEETTYEFGGNAAKKPRVDTSEDRTSDMNENGREERTGPSLEDWATMEDELTDDGLPTIDMTDIPLRVASHLALDALLAANNPPTIFAREGLVVRVVEDEKKRPRIPAVDVDVMRGCLKLVANFGTRRGKRLQHISPPDHVIRDILAMHATAFPPIAGITETPIVRPNGTIADKPGYDAETRLYLKFAPGFKMPRIPKRPIQEQARKAIQSLDEVIGDFPFVGKDKANEIALLCTMVMRPAIAGIVPMAHLDAPMAGTGKGLLASLNCIIATGTVAAATTAPTKEEEWEKRIMATLGDGRTIMLIDNVRGVLTSATLEALLTTDIFSGRILGLGKLGTYDNRLTCMVTGNNMQLGGDLPRRVYQIRLDAKTSRPEDRDGFKHPEPIPWLKAHRGTFLGAILTVIRAWYAAGKPMPKEPVKPMGSYEEWTRIMDGILNYCGVEGFLASRERTREQSAPDVENWESFLSAWYENWGETPQKSSEIEDFVKNTPEFRAKLPASLQKAFDESLSQYKSSSFTLALSKALKYRVDVRFGPENIRIERVYDNHAKTYMWLVRKDEIPSTDTPSEGDLRGLRVFAGVDIPAQLPVKNENNHSVWGEATVSTPANTRTPANVTPISLFDEVTVSDGDDGFSNSERVPCVKCGTINWAYNTKFPQKGKYVCYKCHKRLASVA